MAKEIEGKDIGVGKIADQVCADQRCPHHGHVKVRGSFIKGVVAASKMGQTVVVRVDYLHYVPKYKRYERRRSRIFAHNPPCVAAREGDRVTIGETRPLTKNVHFVILEKVNA